MYVRTLCTLHNVLHDCVYTMTAWYHALHIIFLVDTGQFWGVPFTVVDREMDGENYTLTMFPPALPDQDAPRNRTFPAMLSDKTWSLDHKFAMPDSKCLYVGNSQGGPESSLVDSVIEGNWTDYITDSLYETNWTFSRYNAGTCPWSN